MYIILAYDVESKRCNKFSNICKKYLLHEQKSLFEGEITKSKFLELNSKLIKIKSEIDDVKVYILPKASYLTIINLNKKDDLLYF